MTHCMVSSNTFSSFYMFVGTKNVATAMTCIATGAKKRAGITWYPKLSDDNGKQ